MRITFKSIIKNDNDENIIEFTSSFEKKIEYGMNVYEFIEPKNKVMNRIEVSENKVNIFTGPSTINLELNQKISNRYETTGGLIYFDSFLYEIQIKEKEIYFNYSLIQGNKKFGDFKIQLTIFD